jgi:tetratricopeptide (TPR) repeat protein/transcriptional regulator with XRE-family HTH domain
MARTESGQNQDNGSDSVVDYKGIGLRLRRERLRSNLSQEALAERLGTTARSVGRWECGRALPQPRFRAAYCRLLGLPSEALFSAEESRLPGDDERPWSVPHPRNPLFTGRGEVIADLRRALDQAHVQALCGMAGVGKTQLAAEYAHRFRDHYRAVLWVRAESREEAAAGLAGLAPVLAPASGARPNEAAVVHWLNDHAGWLLVVDNIGDLALIAEWRAVLGDGHILVTSRSRVTADVAGGTALEPMNRVEGATFLLRRAKLIGPGVGADQAPEELWNGAADITELMGGLPLAIDQAGAFIEETGCLPADYLAQFGGRRTELLRRRGMSTNHPQPVATTLQLSLDELERVSPHAAALLCVCAFLDPDDISEDMIHAGAQAVTACPKPLAADPYQLAEAVAGISAYSLAGRDGERRSLSVHRLVQAVIRDGMSPDLQRRWAEQVVRLMNESFGQVDDLESWQVRHRRFPHAYAAARLVEEYGLRSLEAAVLQRRVGSYLQTLDRLDEAQTLLDRARALVEEVVGCDHPEMAVCLTALASIHQVAGRYQRAEDLLRSALATHDRAVTPDDVSIAVGLNDLGTLLMRQARYREAEPVLQRALSTAERALGPEAPLVAVALNNLAAHHHLRGEYAEADALFRRTLAIRRKSLGGEHPAVANVLNNLGTLSCDAGRPAEAAILHQEALRIHERVFGARHHRVAVVRLNLAQAYHAEGRLDLAEPLYLDALDLLGQTLGREHPRTARALASLARLRDDERRWSEAGRLFEQARAMQERLLGPAHVDLAQTLHLLARHHLLRRRYRAARDVGMRALGIRRSLLGPHHPETAATQRLMDRLPARTGEPASVTPVGPAGDSPDVPP